MFLLKFKPLFRPVETGGGENLLPIHNNSEKKQRAKKYKPYQIPRKLLVTVLLFT